MKSRKSTQGATPSAPRIIIKNHPKKERDHSAGRRLSALGIPSRWQRELSRAFAQLALARSLRRPLLRTALNRARNFDLFLSAYQLAPNLNGGRALAPFWDVRYAYFPIGWAPFRFAGIKGDGRKNDFYPSPFGKGMKG